MSPFAATFDDVVLAAQRLHGIAHRTPALTSSTLDARTEARVFVKPENLQRMGAFKFRGAYNRLVQLDAHERIGGAVAFSSGNHAQGVALAAQLLAMPAVIVMPHDAPLSKLAATRGYGAEVVLYDRKTEDRHAIAQRLVAERKATLVPPFDDAAVIAGAGTAAMELIEDVGPLDVLVVCTGGGGFLAGSALAATALAPQIAVYGVEPEAGDDWVQSLARGERVTIPVPDTIADGMQTTAPGVLNFPIVQALCAGVVTVSDAQLCAAMRFAFERMKLVIEPSGAAALAAVLAERIDIRGKRVGLTISGGNVDASTFARSIA